MNGAKASRGASINQMPFSGRNREKQVRLTVFDNEPMARLAEQRLRQAGIPCVIRSLRGGPGLWGSAYNLPHDLYVYATDENPARELLELEPGGTSDDPPQRSSAGVEQRMWPVIAGAVLVVLALVLVVSLFNPGG